MRDTANFHLEWGYFAPAPSFIRTARVVLVATAVGAIAGAGVVFSLVRHPATETSVAARTLVGPGGAASARGNTPAQVAQTSTPSSTEKQRPSSLEVNGQSAQVATKESSASSTTHAPQGISALAEAPTATDNVPAQTAAAPAAAKAPVADRAPIKRKATTKPNVIRRYASRSELFGLAPGQYYMSGRSYGHYARGGGGWGGRGYQDW